MAASSGHGCAASARWRVDRRRDRVAGTWKGGEETVALGAQLETTVVVNRAPQDSPVVSESRGPRVAEPARERRRAFDVAEQQGDRAGGKIALRSHSATIAPARAPAKGARATLDVVARTTKVGRQTLHIEIWSDIACPWCYVGKRRFEAALAAFEHRDEVSVTWRSFELDPQAPAERSVDSATHLADKYGMTREEAQASQQKLADVAAATAWTCASTSRAGATPSTATGSCTWPRPTAFRMRCRSA